MISHPRHASPPRLMAHQPIRSPTTLESSTRVHRPESVADNVSFWTDTSKSLGLLIAALVVVICFALIAAIVIVTTVEMYIVTYAGIILLGFGGSTFTKDYAVKYLTYAVSVGLKLMVMGLVVSIGQSILTSTAQGFQNKTNTEVYLVCRLLLEKKTNIIIFTHHYTSH